MLFEKLQTPLIDDDGPRSAPQRNLVLWGALALLILVMPLLAIFAGVKTIPLLLGLIVMVPALAFLFYDPCWATVAVVLLTTVRRVFAVFIGSFGFLTINRAFAFWVFLTVMLHRFVFRTRGPFHAHPQNRLALLYAIWYSLSALNALDYEHAIHVWPNMIANLGLFFLIYQMIEKEIHLRVAFVGYICLMGTGGVVAAVGYKLTKAVVFGQRILASEESAEGAVRIEGLAGMGPNNFAVILVLVIVATAVMLFWKDLKRWQWWTLLALDISFIILLTKTLSRTGMLLFILGALIFTIRYRKKIGLTKILVVASIGVVIMAGVASKDFITRFTSISKVTRLNLSEDQSISNRIGLTLILPKIVAMNPVFGIGPGNFPYVTSQLEYRDYVARNMKGVGYRSHNQYGQVIGETGIIGFIIFLTLVGTCIRDLIVSQRLVARSEGSFLWCLVEALTLCIPLLLLGAATLEVATKASFWLFMAIPIIARRLLEEQAAESNQL